MRELEYADQREYANVLRACRNYPPYMVAVGEVDENAKRALVNSGNIKKRMREEIAAQNERVKAIAEWKETLSHKDRLLVEALYELGKTYAEAAVYAGFASKSGAWHAEQRIFSELDKENRTD